MANIIGTSKMIPYWAVLMRTRLMVREVTIRSQVMGRTQVTGAKTS